MADTFPVSGNIDPVTFPHLLVDLHRRGATGSLKVTGPVHPKALYFRGGRVLFGSSNDPRDQLGSILIESGRITREQLDEVNAKVGPGNPLAKVLAESGFVNQRELGEAARMKVESILADVLSWASGSFEFEDGVLPKGAVDLKLSTEKLLLASVQRVSDRGFALRHVELSAVLEPAPDGESALSEVRADVWPLLERLDGRRSLKDAIALTRLDEFEGVKTACAMLFLGIVRRVEGAAAGPELDLAEQAQSGFGGEPAEDSSMYTVPLTPVAVADLPPTSGFAFADATPGYPVPEPESEPEPAAAAAVSASNEAARPFPDVEPEQEEEEPPVFSADTTMLPRAAPIFTMADYLKSTEQPEPKLAFEPKTADTSTETVYAMPAPSVVATPPPDAPVYQPPPEPEPEPAPYSPFTSAAPEPPAYTPFASAAPEPPAYSPFTSASPEPQAYSPFTSAAPEPQPYSPFSSQPTAEAQTQAVEPPPPTLVQEEPPGVLPEGMRVAAPTPSRPTPQDLAALDALLHPSASQTLAKADRPRNEKFEPQFRPPTSPSRRPPARPAAAGRSRLPLVFAGVLGIVLATVAAWYFLLRTPEARPGARPVPPPSLASGATATVAQPTPAATAAASPSPATALPAAAPTTAASTPAPVAIATPLPTPATPAPVPTTTPRASTPPPPSQPAAATASAATGNGPALLRQGALADAARSFAASLAPTARGRFSHQLLTACAPETIAKAVGSVAGDELFILPVTLQGRSCYRLCWGVYDSRASAEAARPSVPSYFTQGGVTPRLAALPELLP
jgi:hypothetical protein